VIAQPNCCAIAGARNAQQAIENDRAADISLDAETLAEMDAISCMVTDHLDDNPVQWK
jgi:aryl-alcohol dehydrogenase-like predicted oxidoreductase